MHNLLYRLFQGRYGSYGTDILTRFLLVIAVILLLISIVFTPLNFCYYIAFVILIFCYFRLFSKNIAKRYQEKETFEKIYYKFINFLKKFKSNARQVKHYHIYTCPNCHQKIRIPRGKGLIMVRCPNCMTEFKEKS